MIKVDVSNIKMPEITLKNIRKLIELYDDTIRQTTLKTDLSDEEEIGLEYYSLKHKTLEHSCFLEY